MGVSIMPNIRYTYKTLTKADDNDDLIKSYAFILLENTTTGVFEFSGYSDFFFKYHTNAALSTLERSAKIIVLFLNHVLIDKKEEYGVRTIKDITIEIGNSFLTEYAYGRLGDENPKSKGTIQKAEAILGAFYKFLYKYGNMKLIKKSDLSDKKIFTVDYPTIVNKEVIHNIPPVVLKEFLKCSRETAPEIALGVAFQVFGGLRASEVCNVSYSIIDAVKPIKSNNEFSWITLDLRYERQMREDGVVVGGIKKPRIQPIHPAGMKYVSYLLNMHKKITPRYKYSDAVFIDEHGNPMTYHTYYDKFCKLKKDFIKHLQNQNNSVLSSHATFLASKKWGSHLLRGCFSNLVASNSKTPQEIAYWRGDSSLDSAIVYLQDTERMSKEIEDILFDINDL